jgi:hypothetical protein
LIDISNEEGWSNALDSALRIDPFERIQKAKTIRAATMDRFAWSSIGQRYGEIYRAMFS